MASSSLLSSRQPTTAKLEERELIIAGHEPGKSHKWDSTSPFPTYFWQFSSVMQLSQVESENSKTETLPNAAFQSCKCFSSYAFYRLFCPRADC